MQRLIDRLWAFIPLALLISMLSVSAHAQMANIDDSATIDRIQLVTEQINLLKNRLGQGEHELTKLQDEHDKEISQLAIEKVNKNLLNKASLDISVSKSNLDSISIEQTDCRQTINWLEKSVQEIENQLNVMNIFGLKFAKNEVANEQELHTDLSYQKKLLDLELIRVKYLQKMQGIAANILTFNKDNYNRIDTLLKSRNLLHIKQQQVKDELAYQQQQNKLLSQLNVLNAKLDRIDPVKDRPAYAAVERDIFITNESANYAYDQSLIARYKDQVEQMKLVLLRSNSISLLNELGDQVQALNKQIARLDAVLKSRVGFLGKHINYLSQRKKSAAQNQAYMQKLNGFVGQYKASETILAALNKNLADFRVTLEQSLQSELSDRQGFPTFGLKTILDLGKEMLLVPTLTFQVMKSLSNNLVRAFESTGALTWAMITLAESLLVFSCFFLRGLLSRSLARYANIREQINSKWLCLKWLHRHFIELVIVGNISVLMYLFDVPEQNYLFIIYMSLVWLVFKSIMVISRLCLVENTQDTAGHDMRLYSRLKWIIIAAGVITALTVFVHLLPLIYELKTLCDRVFLLFLMIISILLLRSWDVVPNLILSNMESRHPYLNRSIRIIGILVPILMFGNSVIGLFGFVNLIMTVSWYEGIFLFVLIGYLILRGLLSDGMEQLSRLVIQYVNNGWLWTEAFLKPLYKVMRITLFLVAWAVLFLLYGWDKQSPIVERLTRLLHYNLATVLNTTITPLSVIELFVVISVFYWTAKWTREFVYRILAKRTKDMGIRNSIAILSQYSVVVLGGFICLRVLGIDLHALTFVAGALAFGIGLGLRDLANNFACGFLILLERPLRVGDIVNISGAEGEVTHIGSRAVSVRTWDYTDLVVPNTEIFNKSFTNWTARDNTVRTVVHIKISRHDNPHDVKVIIQNVVATHKEVLREPAPEVYLKEMTDTLMDFELRYCVNIRQVKSRTSVMSAVLMSIWDAFAAHGIKTPYPQQEIVLRREMPKIGLLGSGENTN